MTDAESQSGRTGRSITTAPRPVAVGRPGVDGGSGHATGLVSTTSGTTRCAGGTRLVRWSTPARWPRRPVAPSAWPPTVRPGGGRPVPAGPLADLLDALADLAATTLAKRADDDVALAPPSRSGRPWASPNGCAPPRPETAGRAAAVHTVSSPIGPADIVSERDVVTVAGPGFHLEAAEQAVDRSSPG